MNIAKVTNEGETMPKLLLKALTILSATIFIAVPVFAQPEVRITGLRRMPRELTVEKVKTHVIAPAHTRNVEMEEEGREVLYAVTKKPVKYKLKPKFNGEDFLRDVHSVLKDNTAGYALQIRQNGNPIYGAVWRWAQTPANLSVGWTGNTRMHIASVSKLLTAIGLVKLLDSKGISYDAKIHNYLPAYWEKGNNIDQITFRHLLRHRSGWSGDSSASDYAFMKNRVASGVPKPGENGDYENMNYGLMRILIPVINGDVSVNFSPPAPLPKDEYWDTITIGFYKEWMQDNVFTPAGVANAGFAPLPIAANSALAYAFPTGDGWDSGDLQTVAGGVGWRLSVNEVLNVMNHVRRKNTILSTAQFQYMMNNKFGLNGDVDSPLGKMYFKKGGWGGNKTEQCVAYFLPDDMELVIFVNSKISVQGFSLHGLIRDIYLNSIE
jgi:CubicO group peptidase (beta-lactamase class C family)